MHEPLDKIEIAGKGITADALLTQKAIAEYLVNERGAEFVFTVKENQPTVKRVIAALGLRTRRCEAETTEKRHGRITIRRIWRDDALKGSVPFPHVQQVFCIEREVTYCKKGLTTVETVYGVTSQSPTKALPEKTSRKIGNLGVWRIRRMMCWMSPLMKTEVRSAVSMGRWS